LGVAYCEFIKVHKKPHLKIGGRQKGKEVKAMFADRDWDRDFDHDYDHYEKVAAMFGNFR